MPRIALQYIRTENGMRLYGPMDKSDEDLCKDRAVIVADVVSDKSARTELQRKAQHLYFRLLATALNNAGWDMVAAMKVLSKSGKIPWSMHAVKERLWKKVQESTYGKGSTTKLNTDEVSPVYEALNLVTSEKLGVSVPFPDKYQQMIEQIGN